MNSKSINRNVWALTLSLCLGVIGYSTLGAQAADQSKAVEKKGQVGVGSEQKSQPTGNIKAEGDKPASVKGNPPPTTQGTTIPKCASGDPLKGLNVHKSASSEKGPGPGCVPF